MKKTQTARAFALSMVSVLLCIAMLVGSTFAWFTDTATTGVNKITSGNLDLVLQYSYDNATWTDAQDKTKIFDPAALYEPGYTEVVYFKVKNNGSLAFKYNIGTNVFANKTGLTAKNEVIDLTKILKFGIIEGVTTAYATRDDAKTAVEANAKAFGTTYFNPDANYLTKGQETVFAMVVYMPEDIANEANHDGTNVPELQFGIAINATQKDSELDSFDNKYDEKAEFPVVDANSFKEAIESGKDNIVAEANIDLNQAITVNSDTKINLNGKTLSVSGSANDGIHVEDGASLTIENGSMSLDDSNLNTPIVVSNNTEGTTSVLNLENVEITFGANEDDESNSIVVSADSGNALVNIGEGVEISAPAMHSAPVLVGKNATVVMDGGVINASQTGPGNSWTSLYGVKLTDATAVFTMNDGIINADGTNSVSGVYASRGTFNFNGGTINVTAGNSEGGSSYFIGIEAGGSATLNLNGGTINVMSPGTYGYAEAIDCGSNTAINYDPATSTFVVNLYTSIWEGNGFLSEDDVVKNIITGIEK